MKSPYGLLHESEQRLNQALADYEAPPSSALAREVYELRLQAAIFNYDISYDTVAIWRSKPSGFAEKVALKSLIHRLYEYDQLNQKHLDTVPRRALSGGLRMLAEQTFKGLAVIRLGVLQIL